MKTTLCEFCVRSKIFFYRLTLALTLAIVALIHSPNIYKRSATIFCGYYVIKFKDNVREALNKTSRESQNAALRRERVHVY